MHRIKIYFSNEHNFFEMMEFTRKSNSMLCSFCLSNFIWAKNIKFCNTELIQQLKLSNAYKIVLFICKHFISKRLIKISAAKRLIVAKISL